MEVLLLVVLVIVIALLAAAARARFLFQDTHVPVLWAIKAVVR